MSRRISFAASLNRIDDAKMYAIADSVLDVYANSKLTKDSNFYKVFYLKTRVLNRSKKFDQVIKLIDNINIDYQSNSDKYIGLLFLTKGIAHKNKGEVKKAVENYSNASEIFNLISDEKSLVKSYNNLGNLYNNLSNYNLALNYYKKSLVLLKNHSNLYLEAVLRKNIAGIKYNYSNEIDQSIVEFTTALNLFEDLENTNKVKHHKFNICIEIAKLFLVKNEIDSSLIYIKKADFYQKDKNQLFKLSLLKAKQSQDYHLKNKLFLNLEKKYPNLNEHQKIQLSIELTRYYFSIQKFSESQFWAEQGLKLNRIGNSNRLVLLKLYSDILEKNNRPKEALKINTDYLNLFKELYNKRKQNVWLSNLYTIENLEAEKQRKDLLLKIKETTLTTEKLKNKNKSLMLILLGLLFLASLIITILYILKKKSVMKKLIAQSKIKDLRLKIEAKNRNEEYLLYESKINAKKEEQLKISRDLHDNLGSNLAAIKLSLAKSNNKELIKLVDEVYNGVKDLSYDLTTIAESNNLFEEIITQFVKHISDSTGIEIDFEVVEPTDLEILNSNQKTELFSILREIFQNIIKHSKAKNVDIIFSSENNNIVLFVEDNGTGFDLDNLKKQSGLNNIEHRVNSLYGNWTIDTRINRGTIIEIFIPIL